MISYNEFAVRQPSYPTTQPTDAYYFDLANDLLKTWNSEAAGKMADISQSLRNIVCLNLIGYYQDVIVDAGIWHAFIDEMRRLYDGKTLPFYADEQYMDYELNRSDVRFVLWYSLAMTDDDLHLLYPLDGELLALADKLFDLLESRYDEAPIPVGYHLAHELELNNPEDREGIFNLSHWLFLHSYLLTPAFTPTMTEIMRDTVAGRKEPDYARMQEMLEDAMGQLPTGPLALFLNEWVRLVLGMTLKNKPDSKPAQEHPYYKPFTTKTGGSEIAFFTDYPSMNRFFIETLGWEEGVEHLENIKGAHDYVLLVNREKGMLVARNVCRCIKAPQNPMYDEAYARQHAIDLLTVRGLCPADLLHYIADHRWLPDACFPGTDDTVLVQKNLDFIARCYLQLYYRGD